ncbi:hypothetical protein AOQ84DRAFT_361733 [Glonium stellatum]|uniref:Malate dehydrogenase n=1 Tax=Glonium stellatum TaxID=574774 RepID=A0A8E2F630_9PEZI|nr:hypothetical protein AOQ84DRAFT_361733 [Glonium stellatum]
MFAKTLTVALCAISLLTLPTSASPWGKPWPKPRGDPTTLSRLVMPSSTLPPPTGLVLKFVGLGIGTQNYTCATPSSIAVPASDGALATLYDLGTRLNTDPMATWKIGSLSGLALSLSSYTNILDVYLQSQGYSRVLGKHFFTSAMVPTFSLLDVLPPPIPQVNGKKNATMAAPANSCPGQDNEGAVPWLYLTDNGGSTGGVNTVYRIETAGGQPPATCDEMDATFTVPYAAQYWIYGPAS